MAVSIARILFNTVLSPRYSVLMFVFPLTIINRHSTFVMLEFPSSLRFDATGWSDG